MEPMIQVENLCKRFNTKGGTVEAAKNISFSIEKGEIFGIIGLSGAGKSTLVRCLNLLERPTSGTVRVNGKNLTELSEKELRKERQKVGMIFQHFNLLMQRTALDNVCFPMEIAGIKKAEARKKALEYLKIVGLEEKALSYPSQLSGGQKQRVAIARALINKPRVLLLDEPLGALDLKLRKQMQLELKRLQRKLNITFIYVTHDQEEALTMSDRIAIMHDGILDQLGTPSEIYEAPKTKFVATFIGETNIFDGTVGFINGDEVQVTVENGFITGKGDDFKFGEYITVSVRPEKMKYSETPVEGFGIKAVVKDYIYVGSVIKCIVVLPNGNELKIERLAGESLPEIGSAIYPYWNKEDAVLIHSRENSIFEALDNVVLA